MNKSLSFFLFIINVIKYFYFILKTKYPQQINNHLFSFIDVRISSICITNIYDKETCIMSKEIIKKIKQTLEEKKKTCPFE